MTKHSIHEGLTIFGVVGFILFVMLWLISAGHLFPWPGSTWHASLLSDAFFKGSLALLFDPPAELVASANPFAPENQKLWWWDTSYFEGKYYFYWGPVPALLVSTVRLFVPNLLLTDPVLVFLFLTVRTIAGAYLLLRWFRRFDLGGMGMWGICTICLCLMLPLPNLLTRPAVYEVAVASAQTFLLLAVLALDSVLTTESTRRQSFALTLLGLFLAFAIGCRVTALFPAGFVLFALFWMRRDLRMLVLPAIPIVVMGAALALYNFVRFHSPFETGARFQLTLYPPRGGFEYLLFNVYQYLFHEVHITSTFPYLYPELREGTPYAPSWVPTPKYYFPNEPLPGLLLTFPLIYWLAPLIFLRGRFTRNFVPILITGGIAIGVLNFVPCLFFFASIFRYIADISSGLFLLGLLGYAIVREAFPRHRKIWTSLFAATLLLTATTGFLLSIQAHQEYFPKNNPALYKKLQDALSF